MASQPFEVDVASLATDELNTNRHTEPGMQLVEDSIREARLGRSVLVDKHLKLIGGASVTEQAAKLGYDRVLVVPTDGTILVAVQRTDLDMDDDPDHTAHRLAQFDNRAGLKNYDLDFAALTKLAQGGMPLQGLYSEAEIAQIMRQAQKDSRPTMAHTVSHNDAPIIGGKQGTVPPKGNTDRLAFPLACVLSRADYNRWEAFKAQHHHTDDTAALLALLSLYEAEHVVDE